MPEEKIEELKEEAEEVKTETAELETAETEVEEVKAEEVEVKAEETAEIAETAETVEKPEEVIPERTLAEAIEIAEKTVKAPKKQYNKKGFLAVTALVLVLVVMISIACVNTFGMSDEEYFELFEANSLEIVEDAYNTVIIMSSRMSYYSENDYIDAYYAETIVDLESSVSETDAMMKELSNPPSTYKEHYEILESFYNSYMECLDLALNYGDDEDSYVETATVALEEFIEYYSALYDIVMESYIE